MWSYFKFSLKDLLIGLVILIPLFLVLFVFFNPSEREAKLTDEENMAKISVIARAAEGYFKTSNMYPSGCTEDWIDNCSNLLSTYHYKTSEDMSEIIIYKEATSLEMQEYCSGDTTNILYSSVEARTSIVCGDNLSAGAQKFID